MTTPTDEITIPTFIRQSGDEGFNALLKTIEPKPMADEIDPDIAKASLMAARPIYDKASDAQQQAGKAAITAEKALEAVNAIVQQSKDKAESEAKAKEEMTAKEQKAEQAREFDAVSTAFTKAVGSSITVAELFKTAGYEELAGKQVAGIDFPITYNEVIGKTLASGNYDQAAIVMKSMYEILNPDASLNKTVNPATSGGGTQKAPQNNYASDLARVNRQFQNKHDFDSIKAHQEALAKVREAYGVS
jgi:flagellar motor switch/type III secretory pathway protein FliN